jgi:Protein of unknown function (DUF1524)
MSTARTLRTTVLTLLATLTLTACLPAHDTATGPASGNRAASTQLAALVVRAEDTGAHYRRDDWGDWTSHGNGCDTRELVLRDQGHGTVSGKGCKPICPDNGPACWTSPYDNTALRDPASVQIDHRVPVKEAVRSGARTWNQQQRERFYNDPANLVAVSAHANTSKGDKDPGRWRPSNRDTWCSYATAYITTKHTYGLSVDQREHDALAAMLATCPAGGAR